MEDGVVADENAGGEGGGRVEAGVLAGADGREEDAAVGEEGCFGHLSFCNVDL